MMSALASIETREVAPLWKWRTAKGEFLTVQEMETTHLFFTIRMIWNNAIPDYPIGKVKRYRFSQYYTLTYIKEAIDKGKLRNLDGIVKYSMPSRSNQ